MGRMGHDGENEPWLAKLRATAQDASNAGDDETVLGLTEQLRRDTVFWASIWAPVTAMAARRLGRPQARELLDEAIAAGFGQPELFAPDLAKAFGAEPDWPELLAAMAANLGPPPIEILSWPARRYGPPLDLPRLPPDRETQLRQRLPRPDPDAWHTARRLLSWVHDKWEHTNSHAGDPGADVILDRVEAGERFACREYTQVLTESLNACGIPARSLALLQRQAYTGVGRAHAVTEAWIDSRHEWVVLDGQNGIYWTDADGNPLGADALQDRYSAGEPPAAHVCVGSYGPDAESIPLWWTHFHEITIGAATSWAEPFVPVIEDVLIKRVNRLLHDRSLAYPDLAEWSIGVTEVHGVLALTFEAAHPFATGFTVRDGDRRWRLDPGGHWPIPRDSPGEHEILVATRTRYGDLEPAPIRYRVAPGETG